MVKLALKACCGTQNHIWATHTGLGFWDRRENWEAHTDGGIPPLKLVLSKVTLHFTGLGFCCSLWGARPSSHFFFSLWKSLWLCVTGRQNHIGSRGPRDVAQKPAPFCTHGHLFLLLLELQLSPAASGCASFWKVGNSSSIISLLEGQMGFESQQTVPCLLNKNQEKLEWKKKKSNNGENKGYISKIFPFLWAQQRSLSSFEERQVGGWQVHFL